MTAVGELMERANLLFLSAISIRIDLIVFTHNTDDEVYNLHAVTFYSRSVVEVPSDLTTCLVVERSHITSSR